MNNTVDILQSLKLRSFVANFRAESAAVWFLCFYILIEYLRPQGMYAALDILPWGQLAIVCCVASVFITGSKAIAYGAMDKIFILISIVVILSGVFAWDPSQSLEYWSTFASWILMYFCILAILTSPNRMLLFVIFFILINFKMSQHGAITFAMRGFSFSGWGLSGSGWFHNSGEFALQMVVVFSMSLSLLLGLKKYIPESRRWWILMGLFPGTAALTVIGSSSRGGQLALVAVVLLLFIQGKRFFRNLFLIAAFSFAVIAIVPQEMLDRYSTIGDDETSRLRLEHWGHAMEVIENEPWGIGYRNWGKYYPAHFSINKSEQIHNTVLEAFVDLGYLGGVLIHLAIIMAFVMNGRTRREMEKIGGLEGDSMAAVARGLNWGLFGTFIAAFFMSVLFYPMYWVAFALTSALRHISRKKVREVNEQASVVAGPSNFSAICDRPYER